MSNYNTSSGGIGFCGLLTIVFIVLKLTHYIDWSWWGVLAPLWAPILLWIAIQLAIVGFAFVKVKYFSTPEQREQMKRIVDEEKRNAGKSKWEIRMEQMQEAQNLKQFKDGTNGSNRENTHS